MKAIQRALVTVLSLAATAAFAADGIAFITNLKGDVAVDGNPRPALLSELAKGQKIAVGKESQASVMYIHSGKEYLLKGPADYFVKDTEISSTSGMPPVTRNTEWRTSNKVLVQVARSSAASVRMRSVAPAKAAPSPVLLFPTQGSVATLQPTFRWKAADAKAAAEFTLAVVGEDKPVVRARAIGGSYQAAAKLEPGTEYYWVVASGGHELGTGKFRTLPKEAIEAIEQRKPAEKADFTDRLMYALLLQEHGAAQEAREAWARLSQERADLPELAALAK